MTSSTAPLFNHRRSLDSADEDDEETALLGGLATTSPTRPFATSFCPTIYFRGIALILAIPSFILFVLHGSSFVPSIVFLSFAIARQTVVLVSYFGSQIVVIRIEVVHNKWVAASARAQEIWIMKTVALVIDGVILLGMLVALSVNAHYIVSYPDSWQSTVRDAVILGFITFGLLISSAPDFGNPGSVIMAVAIERPAPSVVKLATSVQFGELEDSEQNGRRSAEDAGKYIPGQQSGSAV